MSFLCVETGNSRLVRGSERGRGSDSWAGLSCWAGLILCGAKTTWSLLAVVSGVGILLPQQIEFLRDATATIGIALSARLIVDRELDLGTSEDRAALRRTAIGTEIESLLANTL